MIRWILLVGMAVTLFSCTHLAHVNSPDISIDQQPAREITASVVNLPVKINLESIFEQINEETPTTFSGEEEMCEGTSYSYTFTRKKIEFSGQKNGLIYTVPASYSMKLNYCPKCTDLFNNSGDCVIPRLYTSCGVDESPRKVEVEYHTEFHIDKDYHIYSSTKLNSFKSIDPCKITVFRYNATDKVEKEVKKALNDAAAEIDQMISELPLQEYIQNGIQILREPIDLGTLGQLNLNLSELTLSPFNFNKQEMNMDIRMLAFPTIGTINPQFVHKSSEATTNGFSVSVPVTISYDSLNQILQSNFGGTHYPIKHKMIIIDSVEIFGVNHENLNLRVKFSGKKKGTIYLTGTPKIENQVLKLTAVKMTLESKNVLLKSARWLFDTKIESAIEKKFQFDLKKDIAYLRSITDHYLNQEIYPGVRLNTLLSSVNIEGLHMNELNASAVIQFNGSSEIKITWE